uniref:multiple epidermal growth factor-like domains protein 10 isoform X2 n=1 Tax=Ostrea edulis TaxID=37623 RepID=UPI0024AFCB93|nr:multiple epidermal growth factor-like domains protein 10 isoform X2 [Ostrea edulis]
MVRRVVACAIGYFGVDCTGRCPFPSFGKGCQLVCNCCEDQCNHEKGCPKDDCGPGYLGVFCDVKCRYPGFGTECQNKCLCEQKMCDPVKGCQGSLEDIVMEVVTTPAPKTRMTPNISVSLRPDADFNRSLSSRDISSVLLTTPDVSDCSKETSIQSDAASMWKTLNETEGGMVISITTLGLLFLILTVMYIWISHRLHVETIDRRKATEDLDENSTV